MKNKIILILVILFQSYSGFSQLWRVELEKHMEKPVSEIDQEMEKFFDEIGRTRASKYHQYQRWYDYASKHQNRDGYQFNHEAKNKELLDRMNAQVPRSNQTQQRHYHAGWESINPNNFITAGSLNPSQGRINCIAKPSPNSPIIYAGTATGGVWKTSNGGGTWVPLWDGMVQTGVSSIIVDYNNPNHILALTGDADGRNIPSQGVYHSYNGGDTWSLAYSLNVTANRFGSKIIQSKTNQYEYFLALSSTGTNIVRFSLNGAAPSNQWAGLTVNDIEYQTNEDDILWAASTTGLYKQESSETWTEVNHPNLPTGTVSRAAVAMAPSNENVIYYAVGYLDKDTTFYGLYKSPDKGVTWDIMYDTTRTDIMSYQCSYNFTLDVDPEDENRVYIGTGYLYESSLVSGELVFDTIRDYLHADVHNSYHIGGNHYVCTDGGLSVRTPSAPEYYSLNNGLLCTQFYDLDVYGSTIIGGTQDNGTKLWDIGDVTGSRPLASDGLDCMIDPTNPNIMYGSTQDAKSRSINGMASSYALFNSNWHDPMAFAVDNPNKVLIHADTALRVSTNGGATFPISIPTVSKRGANSLTQCLSDPNVLYISRTDTILRTDNFNASPNAVTWSGYPLPGGNNRGVLVHPDSCNVVYRVVGGYNNTQVFKSVDSGQTFDPYSEGVTDLPVYCIYYDHVNGNALYIGTELGVYYRSSTMTEWIPFSTYLPRVPVYDLKINNNYIYAATFGRGVWRSPRYKACSTNLFLYQSNDPTEGENSGQQIHKASNIIVSDRIIRGRSGTDVHYQAGNYIDLIEGFHAKQFNKFTATAAGCLEDN